MAIAALRDSLRADIEPSHRRAAVLFVRMWAAAHVLHLLIADRNALDTPWNVAVVALATVVVLRPESGRLFAAMAVAQLVEYAAEMPLSPDHWALVSLVNLVILCTMLVSGSVSLPTLTRAFPAARIILLTAYGAAALSKWNTAFLDPVTSCANAIAKVVSFGLLSPVGESHVLSYGAALTESLVFLLLLVPKTRRWGVLLGLVFHFSLSASPVIAVGDFTATVFALFFLFLRPEVRGEIVDRTSHWAERSAIVRDAGRRPGITAAIAFVVLGFGGYVYAPGTMATAYVFQQFYFGSLLLAAALTVRRGGAGSPLGRVHWFHVPVLAVAVLWALNPYLGLRTTGSFTMFSNLRTESPEPNHLFMPALRLTDWQDDMVTLVSSNDEQLQSGADKGLALPLVGLRRMAMDDPDLEVTGILHGDRVTFGPGVGQTDLPPLPAWHHKMFLMRPVAPSDVPFCSQS